MSQLSLFDQVAPIAPVAAGLGSHPPADWAFSSSLPERVVWNEYSAAFWQERHEQSGLQISQEGIYAGRLRTVVADMIARPEFYERKPAGVTDFRWYFGEAA